MYKPRGNILMCACAFSRLPTLQRSNFKKHNCFFSVAFFSSQTNLRIRRGIRVFQQTKANSTKTWQLQRVQRILNRIQSQLLVKIPLQEVKNIHPFHSLTADVSSKYQKAMIKACRLGSRKRHCRRSVVSPLAQSRLYEKTVLC